MTLAVSLLEQSAVAMDKTWNNNGRSGLTLNGGGTFNTGRVSEHDISSKTAGMGALTLQSSSIIDMGNAASTLAFTDNHTSWWSGTPKIYNWSGTLGIGAETDDLFFGSNGNRLTSSQLAGIQLFGVQERLFMAAQ